MTYALLAVPFLAAGLVLAVLATQRMPHARRWWAATLLVGAVLVVLTGVFDSLMVAADLFRYHDAALLGPRVLLTPVEDFAWPVFAVLAVPALWELVRLPGRGRDHER
jgi:small toxic polypeptide LdrA/B/C/D